MQFIKNVFLALQHLCLLSIVEAVFALFYGKFVS